jgi:hypothetical protein
MPILIIIGAIALIIVFAYLGHLAEKKRREALAALAASCGLTYSLEDPLDLPGRLGHIHAFNRGHDRKAKNVLEGTWQGREVVAFDFKYTTTETSTNSKGHTTTREVDHWFSACVHPLELSFPSLSIRPEGFFDKIGDFLGFDDIDFESDEFSRRFRVTSDDRKFAYDVCHPRMMEWLLARRGWHMELVGGCFVLTDGGTWKPEKFRAALDFTAQFFAQIPEFVWREWREKRASS